MFEEQYLELRDAVDEIAKRMRMMWATRDLVAGSSFGANARDRPLRIRVWCGRQVCQGKPALISTRARDFR
jgi:hypothetical protein